MIALACLAFWVFGIGIGVFGSWLWRELRDDTRPIPPAGGSDG